MSEFDPITNASGYAYAFTNTDAPAYARDAIDLGDVTDFDSAEEWAHETADSMAAVIYTGQAVALYASGLFDNEDDDGALAVLTQAHKEDAGAPAAIDRAICALSYAWHKRLLLTAVEELLQDHAVA